MTVRADAEEKETALLKSRLATPRSPQVVYDTDKEESDNNRGTNSSDQMENSGDELDRAHEVVASYPQLFRFIFCPQVLKITPIVKQIFHFPLFVADYYPSQGSQVLMAAYKPDIPFQDS